jgi:uncharacterized protein CbrC (UPF0167 family)
MTEPTALPVFRYHPDPVATGSVVASSNACRCCGRARGYIYAGPAYARDELDEALCPWCIADGSAAAKFDATFTDEDGIGGYGDWDAVTPEVVALVATRTPGFAGWQQEQWWTHCGDAAAFLGAAGRTELLAWGDEAITAIRDNAGLDAGAEWDAFFQALDRDSGPTAYVFRCLHCGALGGYQDCH